MTGFRDLDEFFDPSLRLPIGGKTYTVPPPDAEVGLLCQRLMHAGLAAQAGQEVDQDGLNRLADAVLSDEQEKDLYKRLLGPVWEELFADRVSWPVIQHVGETALLWVAAGVDAAARHWEAGAGEAQAPANRKTRRAAAAQARSTRSRGSRSGTTRTTAAPAAEPVSPGSIS